MVRKKKPILTRMTNYIERVSLFSLSIFFNSFQIAFLLPQNERLKRPCGRREQHQPTASCSARFCLSFPRYPDRIHLTTHSTKCFKTYGADPQSTISPGGYATRHNIAAKASVWPMYIRSKIEKMSFITTSNNTCH